MITFGITGGICCGKSTVSRTVKAESIPVVDADIIARQVVEPGTIGLKAVATAFGSKYLAPDGSLDRVKLGELVFSNKIMRHALDLIMLPLISKEAKKQLKSLQDAGHRLVAYDAALIIEMNHQDYYRPLIVVQCREDTQIERLMQRNGLTRAEALHRIEAQMPTHQKVAIADYVVNTDGTLEQSVLQTKNILHKIQANMYKDMVRREEITYAQVPHPWRDTLGNDKLDV